MRSNEKISDVQAVLRFAQGVSQLPKRVEKQKAGIFIGPKRQSKLQINFAAVSMMRLWKMED